MLLSDVTELTVPDDCGTMSHDNLLTQCRNARPIELRHGQSFTGRVSTQIFASDTHIIKVRAEYNLSLKDSLRFIQQKSSREHELGIYHPEKTWFIFQHPERETPYIANITQRLFPLNDADRLRSETGVGDFVGLLIAMFDMYLKQAREHDHGLDISVSNFAIDREGNLYYVDDDIYSWDNFHSLSHYVGTLLRAEIITEEASVQRLAQGLRDLIVKYFEDSHLVYVVSEEVRGLFLAEQAARLRDSFVAVLRENKSVSRSVVPQSNGVVALLADVHANMPALEVVLDYLAKRNIGEGYVLGDIVGYGPHPAECLEALRAQSGLQCIKGNHDHAAASGNYGRGFSSVSRWVIEWTTQQLSAEQREWLAQLPLYLEADEWLAVHGAPNDTTFFNAYVYEMTYEDNLKVLEERGIRYCFHGHTHVQATYVQDIITSGINRDSRQELSKYRHALVCPGSVGQPRSNVPGAELALLDTSSWELEFIRLDYDLSTTIADMNKNSFPPWLGERLEQGK